MKVKDCMCDDVCCVSADTKLSEVAKLMSDNHIGCIPVCDENNCLCGVVTDRDMVLRCIACDKDVKETPVSDIMSCNVCSCSEDDDMSNAEGKMCQNQIRRLPVCDESNHVVGILTMGNLANSKELDEKELCSTISGICDCNSNKNAE